MATKLGALNEFFSPGLVLTAPDRDKVQREYTIPLASAELGLWCRTIATARSREDVDEADLPELPGKMTLAQRVLGTAYDEMVRDGVPDAYIEFCSATAFIWISVGETEAETYWLAGGDPNVLRPGNNRAEKRALERAGGTSTAADGETKPPASTSGTTSRPRRKSRRGR
ncbi:hypothetical protein GCM10010112_67930 [Actinoplanes lobatus]|uniref:DUF7426 domain-containing protein n=1 Tax=Actinoplanes lobatus TaxID=113568 RepID=A0A7W7HEL6_9ACTN|nr:hypothetical protein [Actinoplanes lobatus]MBB4749127.1 hypothetical protein [Actinoplanes lobatus]GGN86403.1 hypothetical protein GCM10010112_67930 [Actinoplanes lobatus]GIE42775.1 hypothetical protein Alo02nite_56730 [Actinoplanes lobatus]